MPIGTARSVDTNYTGSEVFQPASNGQSVYVGNTGGESISTSEKYSLIF